MPCRYRLAPDVVMMWAVTSFRRPFIAGDEMRYMLLIYGPDREMGADGSSTRDAEAWIAYSRSLVDAGIHRGGEPLAPTSSATTVRVRDGRRLFTDGPFAETKEVLGGYYVLECDDLDAALDAAARCPGAAYGSVEVRPLAPMPGLDPA